MNFSVRALARCAACACVLSFAAVSETRAQGNQSPSTTPALPQGLPAATQSLPPTVATTLVQPTPITPREQRAKAYAKLLEGQRYYSRARSSGRVSREGLQLAQQAFKQAGELDPTLAEAQTAQAEIHFLFLNDLEAAQQFAAAATRIDPNNFGGHRLLARIFALKAGLDESRFNRAAAEQSIAELREVVRLAPNDAEAHALLGEFYLLTGRKAEAVASLTRWAAGAAGVDARFYEVITGGRELNPAAAAARLAEVLLRENRAADALAAIRRALALAPENAAYLSILEQVFEAGAEDQSALVELQRMVADNPTNLPAIGLLARMQSRAGRVDEAAATLRLAVNRRANTDREQRALVDQLAAVYTEALRFDDAIAAYDQMLKTSGIGDAPLTAESDKEQAVWALTRIVELQKRAERYADALATIERMRRLLGAENMAADELLIEILREQGKRREALQEIQKARVKYPSETSFKRLEATTLAELGRVAEATALLRGQLNGRVDSDYFTYLALIQLLIDAGRGSEAVTEARKLLEITPPDQPRLLAQSLIMLSSAQERAGDPKGAEESLRKILTTDPNNATVLNNLGYFLTERNERLNEALELVKRA
ncbi:MAG: tetratricopeptide repeat protein, partial [Acidobacteriota bacterium]|nr:tetratricopeptide repeat protein [Acidobacteriota bacterium]